uniref:(California timema) hypothetical protein n=1 Tax=Timema californicum TaxID=61474 RepID=A0A7R9PB74_TIMCA|nr:unnamed protein product [Timema californicum]
MERFHLDSQNAPEDRDNNRRSSFHDREITFVGTRVIQRVKTFNLRLLSNSSILAKGVSAFQSDLSVLSMVSTVMGVSDTSDPTFSYTTPSTARSQVESNNNPYPRFPDPFDDLDYALHMRKALDAVESWLYEQGFRCSFSARLPEGMANMVGSVVTRWRSFKPKKSESSSRTIIDLLGNLVQSQVVQSFSKREFPSENLARVEYVHSMYEHLISFLTVQGACVVHLPELLLNYEDYTCYVEQIQPFLKTTATKGKLDVMSEGVEKAAPAQMARILEKEAFGMISKQAWMDVILQIHKTLVLAKVTRASMKDSSRWKPALGTTTPVQSTVSSVVTLTSSADVQPPTHSTTTDHLDSNVYSQPERILLTWLSSHFKTQRERLWEDALPPRDVANFDRDLHDGLVLAAVTTVFCPYLTSVYFHDLYLDPQTPEQKYHNAVRLTDAWHSVVLGFTVKPEDIVRPCAVKLLMLTAYLYNALPSMYPKETILFSGHLTHEVTREIQLINPNGCKVGFTVRFIGDPQGMFSLAKPRQVIHVQGRNKGLVFIKYRTRRIAKVTATLVLCGSTLAPHFARNICFSLEGNSTELAVSASFNLEVPLYAPTDITLPVSPPYTGSAEYEVHVAENEPSPTG